MDRRVFMASLASGLLAAPMAGEAQQSESVRLAEVAIE